MQAASGITQQVHTYITCTPYPCALPEEDMLTVIALKSVLVSEECCSPFTVLSRAEVLTVFDWHVLCAHGSARTLEAAQTHLMYQSKKESGILTPKSKELYHC